MTRLLPLALVALLAAPGAFAQYYRAAPGPAFGLKAGLNVADLTGADAPVNTDPRLGFSGGLMADVPITPMFSVRPEVLYSQKGVSSSNNNETASVDYIEIPVLVAATIPATETGLMLGAYVGPALGVKVREKTNGFAGLPIGGNTFKSTDLGAAFGVTVGAGPFMVDGRYTLGLQDAVDESVLTTNRMRNGVFTFSGVYLFGR